MCIKKKQIRQMHATQLKKVDGCMAQHEQLGKHMRKTHWKTHN